MTVDEVKEYVLGDCSKESVEDLSIDEKKKYATLLLLSDCDKIISKCRVFNNKQNLKALKAVGEVDERITILRESIMSNKECPNEKYEEIQMEGTRLREALSKILQFLIVQNAQSSSSKN